MNNAEKLTLSGSEKKPVKIKGKSLERSKARLGWLFVLPFILGFALVYLPMIFESLRYAFSTVKIIGGKGGYEITFVWFENFTNAITEDSDFVKTLVDTILILIMEIPAIVIFSLFMAIMLNQKMKSRAVFRAIFFIPVIVSTGIIAWLDAQNALIEIQGQLMDASAGSAAGGADVGNSASAGSQIISMMDISSIFGNMMIGRELLQYVMVIVTGVYDIINRAGVQMLIFLAGLQSISPAIYESCYMEGATAWETFWKITFPMISPMILVNTIYTVIDSFTDKSNKIMEYIATTLDKANSMPLATAMSWIYFLIVMVMLLVFGAIVSAFVFYQRKD